MKVKIEHEISLQKFKNKLKEFSNLEEGDGDITDYIYDYEKNGIHIRAYPSGEKPDFHSYPVTEIRIEVRIKENVEWHENLSAYRKANLRNGDKPYKALADDLEQAVENAGFYNPDFIAEKGSNTFTTAIEV